MPPSEDESLGNLELYFYYAPKDDFLTRGKHFFPFSKEIDIFGREIREFRYNLQEITRYLNTQYIALRKLSDTKYD